jgi:hypothetical protein
MREIDTAVGSVAALQHRDTPAAKFRERNTRIAQHGNRTTPDRIRDEGTTIAARSATGNEE